MDLAASPERLPLLARADDLTFLNVCFVLAKLYVMDFR
jgi:hypothetical protein